MSNLKNILQSFHQRDNLNPKIWKKSESGVNMNPRVREKLLEISKEFIEFLKVDIVVSDIIMTGSLANFNWSNFSDVDLHIIVDFKQFKESQLPLYEELFKLKKTLFNDKHDITIYGYDVELYVQDESESHFASGVFSVLKNEWITKPKKEKFEVDTKLIKNKAQQWMKIIDGVIEAAKDEPIEEAKRMIQKYKDKIKKYRTCGLEKKGEYSDENLVFKTLRRNNYIQKLFDFDSKNLDKKLSLKESNTNIGGQFKTDLENGPKNHAGRALGNWQSDNAWDIFAPPGSVVNSYTNGVVKKIGGSEEKKSGAIFGVQVTVAGTDGFPDIFYTHIVNVKFKVGDTVKVGDYIGVVSEWKGHPGMEHVHIGLPTGKHIKELLVNSDIIFSGKDSDPKKPDSSSTEDDKDFKLDNETNTLIISSIKKLIDDSSLKDLPSKEKINSNLEEIVDGQNKVMRDFYNILKNKKEFKNLQGQGTIPVERGVELLQTGLQYLGFLLPKWGVDGKFGNETEDAVKQFEKKYDLKEDGLMSNEDLTKLFSLLVLRNFKDTNMSSIKFDEDPSSSLGANLSTGNVELKGSFTQAQRNNIAFLIEEMKKIGITNPYTQIGILSVIGKETGYIPKSEISYATTPNAHIRKTFGRRVAHLSDSELENLKKDERKFFNLVYAKTVGNQGGDDGFKYRGRGFNQLTGIKNYEKYSNMIGMGNELVQNPDLLNKPEIAAKVALAFFTKGKSPSTFPNFTNKEEAATYFADINAGGGVSGHRSNAVAASEKFGVKDNIS